MKKLETKQVIGLAALAVGALVVGKIVRDIKKIRDLTAEKEALLAEEEEILAVDPELTDEPAIIELEVEDAPMEELIEVAPAEAEETVVAEEATAAPAEETETV